MTTAEQEAERILQSEIWDVFRPRIKSHLALGMKMILADRVRDLVCMLHFKQTHGELRETDDGILKLASVFPDALVDSQISNRYAKARHADDPFADKLHSALSRKTNGLDARVMVAEKAFLYLNWITPWQFPNLENGLLVLTNRKLSELLRPIVKWDEHRVKKEVHALRLTHDRSQNRPISLFLKGEIKPAN